MKPKRYAAARTKLHDPAHDAFRVQGYVATTVDDICAAARATKDSFCRHFLTEERSGIAVTEQLIDATSPISASAPFRQEPDPRDGVWVISTSEALCGPG